MSTIPPYRIDGPTIGQLVMWGKKIGIIVEIIEKNNGFNNIFRVWWSNGIFSYYNSLDIELFIEVYESVASGSTDFL